MSDKPIGYRELDEYELSVINEIKEAENAIGDLVNRLRGSTLDLDLRFLAIGVTDLQKGFMALTRSVAKSQSRLK